MNAMMNDVYGSGALSTAGVYSFTVGTTAAAIAGQGIIRLTTVGDYTLANPTGPGQWCEILFESTQGSTATGSSIILYSLTAPFDGTNVVARSTSALVVNEGSTEGIQSNKALSLMSVSTAAWRIMSNLGLTGLLGISTST